jgi:hypothetical protein
MGILAQAGNAALLHRFLHDILFGVDIIVRGLRGSTQALEEPSPAAEARPAAAQAKQPPLQLLLHVSNITVLLPASST